MGRVGVATCAYGGPLPTRLGFIGKFAKKDGVLTQGLISRPCPGESSAHKHDESAAPFEGLAYPAALAEALAANARALMIEQGKLKPPPGPALPAPATPDDEWIGPRAEAIQRELFGDEGAVTDPPPPPDSDVQDTWVRPPGMDGWRAIRHVVPRRDLFVFGEPGVAGTAPDPKILSRRRWTSYQLREEPGEEQFDLSHRDKKKTL